VAEFVAKMLIKLHLLRQHQFRLPQLQRLLALLRQQLQFHHFAELP
jgi:hypothetical protein